MLAISALTSLLILAGVVGTFKRRDYPGRITMVSAPSEAPLLRLVFDAAKDPVVVPLSHSRLGWFDGMPPDGLLAYAVKGDRIVYRWDRLKLPGVGWGVDHLEYRVLRNGETRCFPYDPPAHFWGIIVGMILAPIVIGAVIAGILGFASGRRAAAGT